MSIAILDGAPSWMARRLRWRAIEAAELMEQSQWLTPEEARAAAAEAEERAAVADKAHRGWVRRPHSLSRPEQHAQPGRKPGGAGQTRTEEIRWTNEHRYPADEFRIPPQVDRFRRPERGKDGRGRPQRSQSQTRHQY